MKFSRLSLLVVVSLAVALAACGGGGGGGGATTIGAGRFGGGGHRNASGATLRGVTLTEAQAIVRKAASALLADPDAFAAASPR